MVAADGFCMLPSASVGPAVYLTAGVLVVPLAKQKFSGGAGGFNACDALDESGSGVGETDNALWAFWLACAFTSCISFALKLIAHVLQQKLIGEHLSLTNPAAR